MRDEVERGVMGDEVGGSLWISFRTSTQEALCHVRTTDRTSQDSQEANITAIQSCAMYVIAWEETLEIGLHIL